mmetsp:Transcript_1244/g.3285  ORF Transcript_1244/g.3285 Transcript_1244/m.3285 type:complete len:247 (-) Transcript_1244:76-816(-)
MACGQCSAGSLSSRTTTPTARRGSSSVWGTLCGSTGAPTGATTTRAMTTSRWTPPRPTRWSHTCSPSPRPSDATASAITAPSRSRVASRSPTSTSFRTPTQSTARSPIGKGCASSLPTARGSSSASPAPAPSAPPSACTSRSTSPPTTWTHLRWRRPTRCSPSSPSPSTLPACASSLAATSRLSSRDVACDALRARAAMGRGGVFGISAHGRRGKPRRDRDTMHVDEHEQGSSAQSDALDAPDAMI